jgi:LmbE family N-acetylglucosaminyl deacetylase
MFGNMTAISAFRSLRRRIMRRIVRLLFAAASRQALGAYSLYSRYGVLPQLDAEVPGGNVLVLAPHMDDEVFGCGGMLVKHIRAGALVTVVYMTDGRKGNPSIYGKGLGEKDIREAERDLSERRKREAEDAADVLGVQELVFLEFPDGALPCSQEAVKRLENVLLRVKPDRVYLPSLLDHHADHWRTNCVFRDALQSVGRRLSQLSCWGYEIWPPLYANRVVDISDVVEVKRRAIHLFESQLRNVDYARVIMSLNAYRSFFHGRAQGYAEAFFSCDIDDYLALFKRIRACREGRRLPSIAPTTEVLVASRR